MHANMFDGVGEAVGGTLIGCGCVLVIVGVAVGSLVMWLAKS